MRVLVAAGGSGGHVYPALAVLEELRDKISQAAWIGCPSGIEARILADYPWVEFLPLPSRGLRRDCPWTWPLSLAAAVPNLGRALFLVWRFQPDVVLGMGGHPAFAPVLAAVLLGVPVAIHEQNARLGLANRVLAPITARVLLSFPATKGVRRRRGVLVTGNPVRRAIVRLGEEGLGRELLVFGGSRGSRRLVEAVIQAAPSLARVPGLRLRLVVGGTLPPGEVAARLRGAGLARAEVVTYVPDMAEALRAARLVVSRAGATTVAELAAAGRPAILVPWEGAAHGHQQANAQACAEAYGQAGRLSYSGCLVLPERELGRLGEVVARLWTDEGRLQACRQARAVARPDAAMAVAQVLVGLARGTG